MASANPAEVRPASLECLLPEVIVFTGRVSRHIGGRIRAAVSMRVSSYARPTRVVDALAVDRDRLRDAPIQEDVAARRDGIRGRGDYRPPRALPATPGEADRATEVKRCRRGVRREPDRVCGDVSG